MENKIILKEMNGEVLTDSRYVAEKFNKEHRNVIRDIRKIIDELGSAQNCAHLFKERYYVNDQNNQEYPMFELTRDGFSLLAMGFTGKEALRWKLDFIEAFNKMEDHIKRQSTRMIPSTYKDALIQLIEQLGENEKLLEEVDRYKRFLCDTNERLSKTQLATKLDTKPQTLAANLKKAGVYTKTSQIKEDFLRKYPNTKLIIEKINPYTDPNTKEEKEDVTFEWTYEGAKTVVDYLISLGMVTYTDNLGFKLVRA
jgi:Rha family phage regulatory protein